MRVLALPIPSSTTPKKSWDPGQTRVPVIRQLPDRLRIDKERGVASDVNIDEVELRLRPAQFEVL